jgi:hypothetical protein
VRDFVHVMDLASGHLRALECLEKQDLIKVNLGSGRGTSVLELVQAFSKASGKNIPVVFAPRRHRLLLRQPRAGPADAGLARDAKPGRYMPGHMAVAKQQPARVRRGQTITGVINWRQRRYAGWALRSRGMALAP